MVLTPRRWRQVRGSNFRGRRWQTSPVTEESTKETVKTIARGMPGVSGVTVVTTLVCLFYFACEAAGASCARHSLRPLIEEGGTSEQNSREMRGEIAKLCQRMTAAVCFRHCEPRGRANARPMTGSAKQSIERQKRKLDCFVANAPRNDGWIQLRDLAA